MTKEEIKQIIPHRDAMLLLDEVEQEEDTAVGTLRIRGAFPRKSGGAGRDSL